MGREIIINKAFNAIDSKKIDRIILNCYTKLINREWRWHNVKF